MQPGGIVGGDRFEITLYPSSETRYVIQARPLRYGPDGYRSFWADQTGAVGQTFRDEPATAVSESVK
jgi:hypothetical protein